MATCTGSGLGLIRLDLIFLSFRSHFDAVPGNTCTDALTHASHTHTHTHMDTHARAGTWTYRPLALDLGISAATGDGSSNSSFTLLLIAIHLINERDITRDDGEDEEGWATQPQPVQQQQQGAAVGDLATATTQVPAEISAPKRPRGAAKPLALSQRMVSEQCVCL